MMMAVPQQGRENRVVKDLIRLWSKYNHLSRHRKKRIQRFVSEFYSQDELNHRHNLYDPDRVVERLVNKYLQLPAFGYIEVFKYVYPYSNMKYSTCWSASVDCVHFCSYNPLMWAPVWREMNRFVFSYVGISTAVRLHVHTLLAGGNVLLLDRVTSHRAKRVMRDFNLILENPSNALDIRLVQSRITKDVYVLFRGKKGSVNSRIINEQLSLTFTSSDHESAVLRYTINFNVSKTLVDSFLSKHLTRHTIKIPTGSDSMEMQAADYTIGNFSSSYIEEYLDSQLVNDTNDIRNKSMLVDIISKSTNLNISAILSTKVMINGTSDWILDEIIFAEYIDEVDLFLSPITCCNTDSY